MLLGYNTWSMPTLQLDQALDVIEGVGYDSVEITVAEGWPSAISRMGAADLAGLKARLADSRLLVSGFTGNVSVFVPETLWPDHRDRLRRCLDLAAEIGASDGISRYVSTTSGKVEDMEGDVHAVEELLIDRFGELAEHASQVGSRIHLEPHVNAVVQRPEMALRVMEGVGSDAFRFTLDISHFEVQGDDAAVVVPTLAPWIGAVEVKDQRGTAPNFDFLIPGEGTQDYPRFLNILAGTGYQGSVSAEISKFRQVHPGYDPLAAVEQTYRVLSRAFEEAGIERRRD